jgi:hypothetical protein
MTSLYTRLTTIRTGLDAIATDIRKRGEILASAGRDLDEKFWKYAPVVSAFPLLYYAWMDAHGIADTFKSIGGGVLSLASAIEDRNRAYERQQQQLDKELSRVSNEQNKFSP